MFSQDTRVIQQHGTHTVHAQRFEVMFHDGLALGLHPVCVGGLQQMFLRATHHEGLRWIVFDVGQLCPQFYTDLLGLHTRDHPGAVFYSLRLRYPTRAAFCAAVVQHALHRWWPHDVAEAA